MWQSVILIAIIISLNKPWFIEIFNSPWKYFFQFFHSFKLSTPIVAWKIFTSYEISAEHSPPRHDLYIFTFSIAITSFYETFISYFSRLLYYSLDRKYFSANYLPTIRKIVGSPIRGTRSRMSVVLRFTYIRHRRGTRERVLQSIWQVCKAWICKKYPAAGNNPKQRNWSTCEHTSRKDINS